MANRYDYQYGTSPRKIEPEYHNTRVKKKKKIAKKTETKNKKKTKKETKKQKNKSKISFEMKFFINSMLFFSIIFAVIACQALVEQRYKEKESLKKEYNDLISSVNVGIDYDDDIRAKASQYGMQTKSVTLIELDTSDYIESSKKEVKMEEKGILEKISDWFKSIF